MLKKASMYLWGMVMAYLGLMFAFGESVAGLTMADNFGTVFFGGCLGTPVSINHSSGFRCMGYV